MSELPETLELGPEDEARRLWKGALEALPRAERDLVALIEALDLGVRAAVILVVERLQGVKGQFPATISSQLDLPAAEVEIHRDAVDIPTTLDFADVLDLLSEEGLECIAPKLHRGWEDRRFSCRRSRATAREALGITLGETQREQLLVLAAYRNRLFRSPPPVRLEPPKILAAFPALRELVEALFEKSPS